MPGNLHSALKMVRLDEKKNLSFGIAIEKLPFSLHTEPLYKKKYNVVS